MTELAPRDPAGSELELMAEALLSMAKAKAEAVAVIEQARVDFDPLVGALIRGRMTISQWSSRNGVNMRRGEESNFGKAVSDYCRRNGIDFEQRTQIGGNGNHFVNAYPPSAIETTWEWWSTRP